MGYTHYWTLDRDFTKAQWKQVISDVASIIAASNVPLAYDYDEPDAKPLLDDDIIRFNGIGDEGHETFLIERAIGKRPPRYKGENPRWSFCKTAHKPYDAVVTAILTYLENTYPDKVSPTSDGEASEWTAGIALASRALNRPFEAPAQVRVSA